MSYIFKSQVIYKIQKADFDLHPTSVIYARSKAHVTNNNEGLQTKILG